MTHHDIIDYKTSAQPWTEDQVKSGRQATLYSYAFHQMKHEYPNFYYVILNKKSKNDIVQLFETKRTKDEIDFLFDEMTIAIEKIEKDQFEPNINNSEHLYWSPFKDYCKAEIKKLT